MLQPGDDDTSVPDGAVIWRRLHWNNTAPDERDPGRRRLSSAAFEDDHRDKSGMSVHLPGTGETFLDYLHAIGRDTDGIAEITVGDLRALGYGLRSRPESNDPRHYEVLPYPPPSKKGKRTAICRIARLVREPRQP